MNLYKLRIGQKAVIKKIVTNDQHNRRLCEMGFVPGTEIIVSRKAPLGAPIAVFMRGYQVILGEKDSVVIDVEEIK